MSRRELPCRSRSEAAHEYTVALRIMAPHDCIGRSSSFLRHHASMMRCKPTHLAHATAPVHACSSSYARVPQLAIDLGGIHASETARYDLTSLQLGVGTTFTIVRPP